MSNLMVKPMREELTKLGIKELKTPEEVNTALSDKSGTALVVVNSVCGCAAGAARPAVALALQGAKKPARLFTVFAGQDIEATAQARTYFTGQPPSSPSVALFKEGTLVGMIHRERIQGRTAQQIAQDLSQLFEKFC